MTFALPAHLVLIVRLEPESDFFKLKIGLQSDDTTINLEGVNEFVES